MTMLLTVRQVAERVQLSEWAVRAAIHDGQLDAFKPRGQLRIPEDAVTSWLEQTRLVAATQGVARTSRLPSRPRAVTLRSL